MPFIDLLVIWRFDDLGIEKPEILEVGERFEDW
jgi:hypothetical protein